MNNYYYKIMFMKIGFGKNDSNEGSVKSIDLNWATLLCVYFCEAP